ncbi:MAG: 2-dehydro-3-deoxy-D-gluconate 5-dehydrogenase KduD [Synergistaceae bacterium]|nr:2-dehydro-3-deoxy-D-gluconate 5-dehydrogenase KduD [Synergistaceae bacterium]
MMTDMFNLSGKVAIVTGARTGIGQGIAEGLAEAGADIIGAGHASMPETEAYISGLGRKFKFYDIDLGKQDKIQQLVDDTIKTFGRLDILVNNAGIIRRQDVLEFSEENWDDVISMNLKSLFFLSQACARYMKDNGGGKIINIASMLSFQGGIRVVSYTASKSGVMGVTKLMANELAKFNIQVNAIAPGYIATNNTAALMADEKRSAEILGRIPADRWGTPQDLKGAAVFLASRASDYVNGHVLAVDGGWLAR